MKVINLTTGKQEQVVACHWHIDPPYAIQKVCIESDRSWLYEGQFEVVDKTKGSE